VPFELAEIETIPMGSYVAGPGRPGTDCPGGTTLADRTRCRPAAFRGPDSDGGSRGRIRKKRVADPAALSADASDHELAKPGAAAAEFVFFLPCAGRAGLKEHRAGPSPAAGTRRAVRSSVAAGIGPQGMGGWDKFAERLFVDVIDDVAGQRRGPRPGRGDGLGALEGRLRWARGAD